MIDKKFNLEPLPSSGNVAHMAPSKENPQEYWIEALEQCDPLPPLEEGQYYVPYEDFCLDPYNFLIDMRFYECQVSKGVCYDDPDGKPILLYMIGSFKANGGIDDKKAAHS